MPPAPVTLRRLGPGDEALVMAAAPLFDDVPDSVATQRFLAQETHHLVLAQDAEGTPLGFITGVETTHPDKGAEMFLYELSVAEAHRRRGIGAALVAALLEPAREGGCHGMWVGTEPDNEAAVRTSAAAGARELPRPVMFEWDLAHRGGP
jgi:aminoglycoside 3-N-acetyltransferase I